MTRTQRNVARATMTLAALYCMTARAELTKVIDGKEYYLPHAVYGGTLPAESMVSEQDIPKEESAIFTPEEGEGMARASRIDAGRKARTQQDREVSECFEAMKEAAADGDCSVSFFAEDALCNGKEEPTGCYENKRFRSKVERLGFRVKKHEVPTADYDDHCASITVAWCRDLRKARHDR